MTAILFYNLERKFIKYFFATSIWILLIGNSYAQNFTLSGYIKDANSGEVLIGATVYIPKLKAGTVANTYGFYSITLPKDSHEVIFSYLGYKAQAKKIDLSKNIQLNIDLIEAPIEGKTVVISAHKIKARENVEKPVMGVIDIPIQQIKELPAFLGEKDLFKVLQLLPGVQSGNEASAGFYVRGGGPDQNLILLDEAVIYNPFHLAGFFSTFNADAIRSVTLHKGGFPAQFGGRLSSIVDITMKDGNNQEYHGEGGIGLISSRLMLEGPIVKNKSSFMVSGRRTYLDQLIRPFLPKREDAAYYFYDINAKFNYRFSDKDRIYLSGYLGKDIAFYEQNYFRDSSRFQIDWGNKSATLRWNHLFSPKLFSNTTVLYNDYAFRIGIRLDDVTAKLFSGIRDVSAKSDFDWYPDVKHKVKFGMQYTYQTFIPSLVKGSSPDIQFTNQQFRYVHQGGLYINDEYKWSDRLALNIGFRLPFFVYKTTEYTGVEPRITAKYSVVEGTSLKAGYTMMNQYIHLVTNSTLATPLDLWIPSTDIVKPQVAHQIAAGIFRNFADDSYESSIEVYFKQMNNLIEYKEGANIFLNENIDKELVFGQGWSYGAEFFVKKNSGKITGWIGYTLAWALRKFPDLNNGKIYPAKYDRRNDLSVTCTYEFNKEWSFSAIFVYGSGHSLTIPYGSFTIPLYNGWSPTFYDYVGKNDFKLKPYNRLDIGIKKSVVRKNHTNEWRFDIYNAYSRRNPYFVYLDTSLDPNSNISKPVAKQVSLFPIIPSISYNFKF